MAGPGFPLDAYLERIGAGRPPDSGAESLHRLHAAQAFAIPLENLAIHHDGVVRHGTLAPEPAYLEALASHFVLELGYSYDAFVPPLPAEA